MQLSEASFLKDIAQHEMTVIADNGLNRHLRFKKPGTMFEHFDILTWPGYLCYSGDMGTFVFRRVPDMFSFFRAKPTASENLPINPGYWSEKLESIDRDGFEEYSSEKFVAAIHNWLDEMDATPELREAVEDDVLTYAEYGENRAVSAALEFAHDGDAVFTDFQETDLRVYTHRFLWCCYALVWGIRQYDEARALQVEPA